MSEPSDGDKARLLTTLADESKHVAMTCEQRDKADNAHTRSLATVKSPTAVSEDLNKASRRNDRRLEGVVSANHPC